MATWYLGPIGNLVQIPAPADPTDASPTLLGGVAQSLGGVVTVDRIAQPRTWQMQWVALTEDQLTYLEAVGFGLVAGPLRLINPMRRNRLHKQISTGGSLHRSTDGWAQTGGSAPTWLPVTTPSTVPVRGAVSWQRTTTAAGSLTTTGSAYLVPVIVGEQLRATVWARGAAIQAAAAVDAWDTVPSAARTTGTAVTLDPTAWTQLTVSYTVASGRVSVTPVLTVASGQATATLQTTGWMVSLASESTTWAPGGGAPTVVATDLKHTYSLYDVTRHGWTMTMREAS